ncbi:hypothetical protein LSCM1_05598 [Leishmania martiniquensis]|uniref:Uncharacterized protein n=1 Tax=Leishmania martiniquensis TaxID=1580590 RepID=A0A836GWS7_9TRYP|nr:hypothetical protein LSCM1_05598 [Leishmania martiniquensis]
MPIILRVCVAIESNDALLPTMTAASPKAAAAAKAMAVVDAPAPSTGKLGAIPAASEVYAASKASAPPSSSSDSSGPGCHSHCSSTLSPLFTKSKQPIRAASADADAPNCGRGKARPAVASPDRCRRALVTVASARGDNCFDPPQKPSPLALRASTSRSRWPPGLPHELFSPPMRHRSLLWLSMQVTLTTTVTTVLKQVQDTVERLMCARVCTYYYHDHNHDAGEGDGARCSLARRTLASSSSHGGGASKGGSGGSVVDDANAAEPSTSCTSAPAAHFHEAELCLCLQDTAGEYHWVGGTRHFREAVVLQAPFITDVCLRSNAIFEEERRRQRLKAGRPHGSPSTQSPSFSTLASGASGRAAAPSAASEAVGECGVTDTPAGRPLTRTVGERKFAFVRGVVMPMAALRQHNRRYAMTSRDHARGRIPRQYGVVRVPADMQEEPPADSRCYTETAATSSTTQAKVREAVTRTFLAAEALPPPLVTRPTFADPADAAARLPSSPNSIRTPVREVVSAEAPSPAAVLTSAFSTPALPGRSARLGRPCGPAEDTDGPQTQLSVFYANQIHPHHSTAAVATNAPTAAGPVGLAAHSTRADRTSDVKGSAVSTDGLRGRGIAIGQACEALAKEEDSARIALAAAEDEYTTALAEYNAAIPHSAANSTAAGICEAQPQHTAPLADAELSSLLQRKIELQRRLEACCEAERQCERLTMLAECLEEAVQEWKERHMLLTQQLHCSGNAALIFSC